MTTPALLQRGRDLLAYLAPEGTDAARYALALEAARMADRLEELDKVIQGQGFTDLFQLETVNEYVTAEEIAKVEVTVKINGVIAEARQQANAFSALLKTLGAEGTAQSTQQKPDSGADVIAKKRAERLARRQAAQ
jgi:HJR/Mrr/RecB family endonuclease